MVWKDYQYNYTCPQCSKSFETTKKNQECCSIKCARQKSQKPLEEIFFSYVDKNGPNGCWVWTGAKCKGYGQLSRKSISKIPLKAHRVAWELLRGPIPDGMEICHDCPGGDNPACVNPAHLFIGSHKQNMEDAGRKGVMGRKRCH